MQKTYNSMIQVQTLKSEGLSNSSIARKVGLHRPRIIDPYLDYIYDRLEKYPELTANRLYHDRYIE